MIPSIIYIISFRNKDTNTFHENEVRVGTVVTIISITKKNRLYSIVSQ